jgi:hypothetical protein
MYLREAILRGNRDGDGDRFSEQATAVDSSRSSPSSISPESPGYSPSYRSPSSTRPLRYTGPKRTYSLVRGNGSKDVLRLVDKAGGNPIGAAAAENEIDYLDADALGDYHIDYIELGKFALASTATNTPIVSPGAGRDDQVLRTSINHPVASRNARDEANSADAVTRMKDKWSNLELDTNQFLSTIATQSPATTPAQRATANLSRAKAIKASIKRTGRGLVIRLLQHLSSGDEEFTDIHMLRNAERNRRVTGWLRETPVDVPASTVATDDTPRSPNDELFPYHIPTEIDGGQIHEMMDTSRPSELSDSGFASAMSTLVGDNLTFSRSSRSSSPPVEETLQSSTKRNPEAPMAEIKPMQPIKGWIPETTESLEGNPSESSGIERDRSKANCASLNEDNTSPLSPLVPQLKREFSFAGSERLLVIGRSSSADSVLPVNSADINDSPEAVPQGSASDKGKKALAEVEHEAEPKTHPEDSTSGRDSTADELVHSRGPEDLILPFMGRSRVDNTSSGELHAENQSKLLDVDTDLAM